MYASISACMARGKRLSCMYWEPCCCNVCVCVCVCAHMLLHVDKNKSVFVGCIVTVSQSIVHAQSIMSGVDKRVVSKRVVLADVPPERKPEQEYIRMFPRSENRNEGTFGCSPGNENRNEGTFAHFLRTMKTGTRVRSPKPPFYKTALLSPNAYVGGGQTCNIDLSNYFYYFFFSFVLIELKPFVLKGKVLGEKNSEKVRKSVKTCEAILPFSCFL